MKEHPILFSAPMVRALLNGSKMQTRRVCKPAQAASLSHVVDCPHGQWGDEDGDVLFKSPYGVLGDRLWVRETHAKIIGQSGGWIETDYFATYKHGDRLGDSLGVKKRWTPSIHMPRAASRINLEVTGVRVERLQDISEADALAEGVEALDSAMGCFYKNYLTSNGYEHHFTCGSTVESYRTLWESINGAGGWAANPWVWVVEFQRIRP